MKLRRNKKDTGVRARGEREMRLIQYSYMEFSKHNDCLFGFPKVNKNPSALNLRHQKIEQYFPLSI